YFDYVCPMVYPSHFAKNFHGYKDPNKNVYGVIQYSMSTAVGRAEATSTKFDFIGAVPIVSNFVSTSTKQSQLYEKTVYDKNKLRPWLQDFSFGGTYGPTEVRSQIQATYDVGLNSWLLWSASNVYTEAALGK
ncbi:MAG: putative glycoside hydrolase, partial [bacterium]